MTIRHRLLAAAVIAAAFFGTMQAAWIPTKALLGQVLLERAWMARLAGNEAARPWPWADTSPVAVLNIPRLGTRHLVLRGASGRNLAWGPAAMTPVSGGDVVISAHRDTHFEGLNELQPGDRLWLNDGSGSRAYRVTWLDIVDSRHQELVLLRSRERLTLVTCYPPNAPFAGGPLRLVVTALPDYLSDTAPEDSDSQGNSKPSRTRLQNL